MCGIEKPEFSQFADTPEELILCSSNIINEQKATAIVQHVTYNLLDSAYEKTIFTKPTLKVQLAVNSITSSEHLYDHIIYNSEN